MFMIPPIFTEFIHMTYYFYINLLLSI